MTDEEIKKRCECGHTLLSHVHLNAIHPQGEPSWCGIWLTNNVPCPCAKFVERLKNDEVEGE